MLFTHFGISGPLVLTASALLDFADGGRSYQAFLNLKPALTEEQLIRRLVREIEAGGAKELPNTLRSLLPARLAEEIAGIASQDIPQAQSRRAFSLNEKEIEALAKRIRQVPMTITGTRGFGEAVVTRGGVSTKEIDPHTLQSRRCAGLYFAGEVIDVDALTGGFNLQIAWSTGHLAGSSI